MCPYLELVFWAVIGRDLEWFPTSQSTFQDDIVTGWWRFKYFFYVHPEIWGNPIWLIFFCPSTRKEAGSRETDSFLRWVNNLTYIFQMGCNHRVLIESFRFVGFAVVPKMPSKDWSNQICFQVVNTSSKVIIGDVWMEWSRTQSRHLLVNKTQLTLIATTKMGQPPLVCAIQVGEMPFFG